jgi:DNA-binding FadR family transcriptional regulator
MDKIDSITRHLLATSRESVANLMEARQVFEASMARLAAERAHPKDLDRLSALVERMRENLDSRADFVRADMAFHVCMAEISCNPIFPAISKAMLNWLLEYHGDLLGVAGLEKLTLSEHEKLVEHIRMRDPDAAARLVSDHILRANELYKKQSETG